MRALVLTLLLLLCIPPTARAWDENWTHARSGQDFIYDKDNSQGDAGTPERPQKFFIPPPREYVDVDPEELDDYFKRYNKDYSPYALARVTQTLHYNGITLPHGYYLIKPGTRQDGSPRLNLDALNASAPADKPPETIPVYSTGSQTVYPFPAVRTQPQETVTPRLDPVPLSPSPAPAATPLNQNQLAPDSAYHVFVIKRLGKVVAVVPIHRTERYHPKRREKVPRHALAWVEMEDRHPVLKFYYRKRVYITDFQ